MVIQSSFFDPVLGVDTHIVGIPAPPAPAPIPTPIPLPFVGMVFDPLGLAIGAAIGMAMGGGPGIVLVNSMPVTNCGTEVTNLLTLPHVSAPGIMFMSSGTPVKTGDAELYFGSLNVSLAGSYGVRLGDIALSCSDPVRLPTSTVLAIPKGMPVLNMPAMVPDLQAIAMALAMRGIMRALGGLVRAGARLFRALRRGSAFMRRVSRALGGCTPPANASRWRQMWHRAVRTVTGHPVDVVTGNLFTSVVDVELPGPLPLTIERVYESAGSRKASALGYGWNHSLDESLWMERGRAVVRCGDGREIEFPLWDLPDRAMRPGDELVRVIHKTKLRCVARERFEVEHSDGRVHEFAPVSGGDRRLARLARIRSRDGYHAIELTYDARGRLEWVRDSAGRLIQFEHDGRDRLVALKLPVPHGRGWYPHRQYVYDRTGDLVEVKDAAGRAWRYVYRGHLLVQETDRVGLSFYFKYDDIGSSAKCVRTWGDGGIYDHAIAYDQANRKTFVENSLGASTTYCFNVRNQVIAVTDAHGQTTKYDYDPDTGGEILLEDPLGARTQKRYDPAGNLVEVIAPDGATASVSYDGYLPVRALDARGGAWLWSYDSGGHIVERALPSGQRVVYGWERGLPRWVEDGRGGRVRIDYDEQKNVSSVAVPTGATTEYECDSLGRVTKVRNPRGGVTRLQYDAEGRVVETRGPTGVSRQTAYDAEGNVVEAIGPSRRVRFEYGHNHRVVCREEAGGRVRFEYDTEDQLTGVINEAGERYSFVLDATGRVAQEIGFDGTKRIYLRDAVGQVTKTLFPSGRKSESRYDLCGRLVEVANSDGTFARFAYDTSGLVSSAENESAKVELERDVMGRVVLERVDGREVRSVFGPSGERSEMMTSLGARQVVSRDALGEVNELIFGRVDGFRGEADVRFERDGQGLELARRFANGVEIEWERDQAGRPNARRTFQRNPKTGRRELTAGSERNELDARVYQWSGDDLIAGIIDGGAGPRFYDHDSRGRLIRERHADRVVERAMDSVGNVYRSADGRDRSYRRGGLLEHAGGYRLERDSDGNQVRKVGPDGSWDYAWNGNGMLGHVTRPDGSRIEFEYDAFARRTAKRLVDPGGDVVRETAFVWDGHVVVHELHSDQGLVTWHFEPESFTPIAKEYGGRRWMIASDHLGTPSEMFDELGALAWKMQLDVFGVATFDAGERSDCPWRWPGQYDDPETDLVSNRFRYFSPQLGAYISCDPLGLAGGFRLFGYALDPTTWTDPFGLAATFCGASRRWRDTTTGRFIARPADPSALVNNGRIDYGDFMEWLRGAPGGMPANGWTPSPLFPTGGFRYDFMDGARRFRMWGHGANPNAVANFPGSNAALGPTVRVHATAPTGGVPPAQVGHLSTAGTYGPQTPATMNDIHIPLDNSPF